MEDQRRAGALLGAVALLLGTAACSSDTAAISPLKWQKVENSSTGLNGSVLGLDPTTGSFDEIGNFTVSAFKDTDGTTFLYYGGAETSGTNICPGINVAHWRIGLAKSTDGVNFTRVRNPANPNGALLDNGPPGSFDSYLTYRPFVLVHPNFRLAYLFDLR